MRREGDRVDPGRLLGPDQKHLARGVVEHEPRPGTEAPRPQAKLAVAHQHEELGAGAGLEHLALDLSSPRHGPGRSLEPDLRLLEQRLGLLVGNRP